jgi:DNA-binding GntR family transcriptional regulator
MAKTPLPHAAQSRVLVDWVTESLRTAILAGHFEPAERLDLDLVASEYQVSRTPLREAVRRLETEGFIVSRPHHGVFVAFLTPDDIAEIYNVRALLEAEIARQVTVLLSPRALAGLEQLLLEDEASCAAGNSLAHVEADLAFHRTIASFCPNRLLKETVESLNNRAIAVRRYSLVRPGRHREITESIQEHRDILCALLERAPDRAAGSMACHLQRSSERLQVLVTAQLGG